MSDEITAAKHLLAAHLVATIVSVGFVVLVAILAFKVVNDSPLMNVMAGSLGTAFTTVVNYYLGSSLGSTQKNGQIADMVKAQTSVSLDAKV